MLIGGITGEITYDGPVGEFLPFMHYCETVHVGKATAFGHGKIRIGGNGETEGLHGL